MTDTPKVIIDQPTEAQIRTAYDRTTPVSPEVIREARDRAEAEIRAGVEREIAEWLTVRDGTDDPDEWQERKNTADAILRGEYHKEGT